MHGLTDDELETMLQESYDNAKEDFDKRHVADLHTEIGVMLHATEKTLPNTRDELDKESVADIEDAIIAARAATKSADLKVVQAARDQLEQATMPLATALMNAVAKQAVAGKTLDEI